MENKLNPLQHFFERHRDKFWWLHSFYALIFGIGVMILGSRHFSYIRYAIWQITFVWISTLFFPLVLKIPAINERWRHRLRLLVNYFNRNIYQQLLFFVLPVYYMSTTFFSRNSWFIFLVAGSAVLSTMDIIYDRFISLRGMVLSLFFSFNLFATVNAMLPILWKVQTRNSTLLSATAAVIGFATFCLRLTNLRRLNQWLIISLAALIMFGFAEFGRPWIPPTPLQLVSSEFGSGLDYQTKNLFDRQTELFSGPSRKIFALTVINAPLNMTEQVRHVWTLNDKIIYQSPFFSITGTADGRFRFWTFTHTGPIPPRSRLEIDVETSGRQLIGRAAIHARSSNR